jgi:hypothetical protein
VCGALGHIFLGVGWYITAFAASFNIVRFVLLVFGHIE